MHCALSQFQTVYSIISDIARVTGFVLDTDVHRQGHSQEFATGGQLGDPGDKVRQRGPDSRRRAPVGSGAETGDKCDVDSTGARDKYDTNFSFPLTVY